MKSGVTLPKEIRPYPLSNMSSGKESGQGFSGIGGGLSEIERDAYERGFAAGEEAGRVLGIKKIEPAQKLLSGMMEELDHLQMELVKAAEQDILALALAVAQRILGKELNASRPHILKTIQEGIAKIGQSDQIIIRLAPSDIEMFAREETPLSNLIKPGGKIKIESGETLLSGECIVEGQERMVDARIKSQMAIFVEAFCKEEGEA